MTPAPPPERDLPPHRHAKIRDELIRGVTGRPVRRSARWLVPAATAAAVIAVTGTAVGLVAVRGHGGPHRPPAAVARPASPPVAPPVTPQREAAIVGGCARAAGLGSAGQLSATVSPSPLPTPTSSPAGQPPTTIRSAPPRPTARPAAAFSGPAPQPPAARPAAAFSGPAPQPPAAHATAPPFRTAPTATGFASAPRPTRPTRPTRMTPTPVRVPSPAGSPLGTVPSASPGPVRAAADLRLYALVTDRAGTRALILATDTILTCTADERAGSYQATAYRLATAPGWLPGPVIVDRGTTLTDPAGGVEEVAGRVSSRVVRVVVAFPDGTVTVTPTNGTFLAHRLHARGWSPPLGTGATPTVRVYDARGTLLNPAGAGPAARCYTDPAGRIVWGIPATGRDLPTRHPLALTALTRRQR